MTKDYSSGASPKLVTFLIKTGGLQFAVPSGGIISQARKVHQRVHLGPGEAMAIHSKDDAVIRKLEADAASLANGQ